MVATVVRARLPSPALRCDHVLWRPSGDRALLTPAIERRIQLIWNAVAVCVCHESCATLRMPRRAMRVTEPVDTQQEWWDELTKPLLPQMTTRSYCYQ